MASPGQAEIAKFGYVEFRSRHLKSFRKRWLVLYKSSWSTPAYLVKYTSEKDAQEDPKGRHQYCVNDVTLVEKWPGKSKGVRVKLNTELKEICFTSDSEAGANDWVMCIQRESAGNRDTFPATLIEGVHVNITGDVALRVAGGHVTIIQQNVIVSQIPLTTIRKYQMDDDSVFWIETGRSSPMGEGFLYFQSQFGYCILTRIDDAARGEQRKLSDADINPISGAQPNPMSHSSNISYTPSMEPSSTKSYRLGNMNYTDPSKNLMAHRQGLNNPAKFGGGSDRQDPTQRQYYAPSGRDESSSQTSWQRHRPSDPSISPLTGYPERRDYPRIPTFKSMPQLPNDRNNAFEPRFFEQDRCESEKPPFRRKDSGSGLVAPNKSKDIYPKREEQQNASYLKMANTAVRPVPNRISEEPYTDMERAEENGNRSRGSDYLTPVGYRSPSARDSYPKEDRYS